MAKRKRRFSENPAAHRARAGSDLLQARSDGAQFRKHLAAGECEHALDFLVFYARKTARAGANRVSAGRSDARGMVGAVFKMSDKFARKCLKR